MFNEYGSVAVGSMEMRWISSTCSFGGFYFSVKPLEMGHQLIVGKSEKEPSGSEPGGVLIKETGPPGVFL